MENKGPYETLRMHGKNLNLCSLRMLVDTFSLGAAHLSFLIRVRVLHSSRTVFFLSTISCWNGLHPTVFAAATTEEFKCPIELPLSEVCILEDI